MAKEDEQPSLVKIVEQSEPVPVQVVEGTAIAPIVTVEKSAGLVASPMTTAEQDRATRGQRFINGMWESTQSVIALFVTIALIYCEIKGIQSRALDGAFTLIIAIYFVRMNHIKIGGVGGTDSR